MSAGFRKSLFGFNSNDVLNYITELQKDHAGETRHLNKKISALNENVTTLQEENASLQAERDGLAEQIQAFHEKFEEIERLAQNIGKLYLVAQNSSKAIMENAAESRTLAQAEVDRNLDSISQTQQTLETVRTEVEELSRHFSQEMARLNESLSEAREKIADKGSESDYQTNQFAQVLEMLDK